MAVIKNHASVFNASMMSESTEDWGVVGGVWYQDDGIHCVSTSLFHKNIAPTSKGSI